MDSVTINSQVDVEWERFAEERREQELDQIIADEALRDQAVSTCVRRSAMGRFRRRGRR